MTGKQAALKVWLEQNPKAVVLIPYSRDISKTAARYGIQESRVIAAIDVPLIGIDVWEQGKIEGE